MNKDLNKDMNKDLYTARKVDTKITFTPPLAKSVPVLCLALSLF